MNPIAQLVDGLLTAASSSGPSPFAVGTVTAVAPGAAADGNALVTVDWHGAATYATYGAHYTPVVGHTVLMARTQPLAILMRIVGTPPT